MVLHIYTVLVASQYKTLRRSFCSFTSLTVSHRWVLSLRMLQSSGLPQSWSINKHFCC